jgi:hypothetical protein
VGRAFDALKRTKRVAKKTQENIESLVVAIVSKSNYDHRGGSKSIFRFFTRQDLGRIFDVARENDTRPLGIDDGSGES